MMAFDEWLKEHERLRRELRSVADVLERLTATMTRSGDSHKYHDLMLEADRAVVRASGVSTSDARLRPAAGGEAVALNVIRQWPEGFAARLEHVWRDLVGFIPSYKLFDLQRTLAEFGFSMVVYEGSAPTAQSGDATNAADGVQASALRELGAHLARVLDEDQWAHAEALLLKVAHGVKEQSNG
jgi:hypothetical protein